jgi:pSer/pThr/pTyr-binding forkhead associated (FHA) protein
MAKLIVGGTIYELIDELITVGRAPDNTVHIDNPSVSSRHSELRLVGQQYRLRDLGSTNGTRINGIITRETMLHPGDVIRFGGVEARFESAENAATRPLPEAEQLMAKTAEISSRPPDFANASPFRSRKEKRDSIRFGIFAFACLAAAALLVALVAVIIIRPPLP